MCDYFPLIPQFKDSAENSASDGEHLDIKIPGYFCGKGTGMKGIYNSWDKNKAED